MPDLKLKKNAYLAVTQPALGVRIVSDSLEIPSILFDNAAFLGMNTAKDFYFFVKNYPFTLWMVTNLDLNLLKTTILEELRQVLSSVIEKEFFENLELKDTNYIDNSVKIVDLKEMLMQLGNKLVMEHRYSPSYQYGLSNCFPTDIQLKSTTIIKLFTDWINTHTEAQEVLAELGFNWSMPKKGN